MSRTNIKAPGSLAFVFIALLIGLSIQPCGAVELKSGVLPARHEPYSFTESITVPPGKVWTVEAGAVLCFASDTELLVMGTLEVYGTKKTPVVFSSCTPDAAWRGITFNVSQQNKVKRNVLQHAIIERADKSKRDPKEPLERASGGGIHILNSDVDISDSVIRFNTAAAGGGIYVGLDSTVTIKRCLIHSNQALGSNETYSGGGGVYIAEPKKTSIWRSTIALNTFLSPNYRNEEGGGGIYLRGSGFQLGFNLVVGNESGKGAGLLFYGRGSHLEEDTLPLIGNIFIYNRGSRNLEQVALQTRFSFEPETALNTWFVNTGQFPFVAQLNREQLVRYVDNGDKAFLRQIGPDQQQAVLPFAQLISDRVNHESITAGAPDSLDESKLCKSKFDFGPIEFCDPADRPNLAEYISRLAMGYGDDDFGRRLKSLLQPGTNLSDYSPLFRYAGELSPKMPDEFLVMAIGSPEMRANTIKRVVKNPIRGWGERGFTLALWAYALGDNEVFQLLLADRKHAAEVLLSAAGNSFEDAALSAYAAAIDQASRDPELMLQTMDYATMNGLGKLVARLLDDGCDPNFIHSGMPPLLRAIYAGQKEIVHLLLLRGANPNILVPSFSKQKVRVPILFASGISYHMGMGFKDMAEMLLAAGANFGSLRFDEYDPRPYFLSNILYLGYVLPPGIPGTPIDYMRGGTSLRDQQFVAKIKSGEAAETPIVTEIRRLRDKNTSTILKDLSLSATIEHADVWQLAAALRILSVRKFDLDQMSRQVILKVYDGKHGKDLQGLVPSGEVFSEFRQFFSIKGTQPSDRTHALQAENNAQNLPYNRKFAVVIGIADYKNLRARSDATKGAGEPFDLSFAEKDATDFKALLDSKQMGNDWDIELLVGHNATREAVNLRMQAIQSAVKEDDLVLLFFSGHGFSDEMDRDNAYLFFYDSLYEKLLQTGMSLGTLRNWILDLRAKRVVVFLDACRTGLFGKSKGSMSLRYDALTGAQFGENPGKVAITSSVGADLSYESTERQNGFFTSLLISALTERIARPSSGNYLTIWDIFTTLKDRLPKETRKVAQGRRPQTPWLFQLDGNMIDFPIAIAQ